MTDISPLFDNDVYDPTADPTTDNWNGQGPGGAATAYDLKERQIAHGIDVSGGEAAFASVRAKAWHNLGTVVDHPVKAAELLKLAHADYTVYKVPDWAHVPVNGAGLPVDVDLAVDVIRVQDPRRMKTVRRNPVTGEWQVLGTVSPTYQVHQNAEAFVAFGDALIDVAEPHVATCGVVQEGRQAFMCWKLPKETMVGGVDAVPWWLLVRTSHDLSTPLQAAITPLRSVCVNTVRWNLANAISTWSIRHTRNSKLALTDARESLKLSYAYAEKWDVVANGLVGASMGVSTFEQIITREFGPGENPKKSTADAWEDKRAKLLHLFVQADTQANVRGTAWAGLQAVTEFCDWETPVRVKTDSEDGYRLWRSLTEEKATTNPKRAALRAFAAYADVPLS